MGKKNSENKNSKLTKMQGIFSSAFFLFHYLSYNKDCIYIYRRNRLQKCFIFFAILFYFF